MTPPAQQPDALWLKFTAQAEEALGKERLGDAEKRLLAALGVAEERCPHLVEETFGRLGRVYLRLGRFVDAERLFERGKDHEGLAEALQGLGRTREAIQALEEAVAWQEQHEVRGRTSTLKKLASLLLQSGLAARAEQVLGQILAIEEAGAEYSWSVLPTLEALATAYEVQGRHAQAVDVVARALELYETHHAVYAREIVPTLRRLSLLCELAGDLDRADELAVRGLDHVAESMPQDAGAWLLRLAALAEARGDYDEACGLLRELLDGQAPRDASELFKARTALARNLCRSGGFEEAEALYALAFRQVGEASSPLARALAHHDLATLYAATHRADKAAEALTASAAEATRWEARDLQPDTEVIVSLDIVAATLRGAGCASLATRVATRAQQLRQRKLA